MGKDKGVLRRDTAELRRQFSYNKGICNLNFTLRVDIKQELKDFLEILEAAKADVKAELDKKA